MANVIEVVLPFDNLSHPELRDLDLVTFLFGYYDTTFMAVDRAKMYKALFDALKPPCLSLPITVLASGHRVCGAANIWERGEFISSPWRPRRQRGLFL